MGENDIYRIRPEHTHGGGLQICDDGSDGTVQKLGFFGVAPTVQRANANQAKLEDSAQLAQVIVLVNELSEALVEKGLIKGSAEDWVVTYSLGAFGGYWKLSFFYKTEYLPSSKSAKSKSIRFEISFLKMGFAIVIFLPIASFLSL